ncbi:hypothetical protein FB645_000923 [Coemansia sp. IMI 203386]|nr:hypothetical protein FB645_000923 [Coemansia sp. IMI 203386]
MKFAVAAVSAIGAIALAVGAYGMPQDHQPLRTIVARAAEANPNVVIVTETVTVTGQVDSIAEDSAAYSASSDTGAQEEEEGTPAEGGDAEETSSAPSQEEQQTPEQTEQSGDEETTDVEETQDSQSSDDNAGGSEGGSDGGGDSSSGETFSGDGTYFTPGLGSCGLTNTDDDLIVAINAPQYGETANPNNAPVCNKCILAKGPKGEVKVTVTDRCPVCAHGDLDFSPSAFEKIADFDEGRVAITWSFVDC